MSLDLLTLGLLPLLALIGITIYRVRKSRGHPQDLALTIEEGLGAIKARISARDAIQGLAAVGCVVCLSCGLIVAAVYAWRQPGLATAVIFALEMVCCIYLMLLLLQKASDSGVIQILADDAHPTNGGGNLHRLMRTYEYYRSGHEVQRPRLFDWLRRQLGLYVLGLDIQAHIPVSGASIAKQSTILMLCVLLGAAMMNYLDDSPNQFDFYHFAEGTTATEIDADSEYRGAPDPDGTTQTPQYGADTPGEPESQFDLAADEQNAKQPDLNTVPPPDVPQEDQPSGLDPPDSPEHGNEQSTIQELVAELAELFGGEMSDGEQQNPGLSEDPIPEEALASAPSEDAVAQATAPDVASGRGTQQTSEPQTAPGSGDSSPQGEPKNTSDNQDAPPSDEGAGGSQQARVSRGGGEGLMGKATDVSVDLASNARNLELQVDQIDDNSPGKESEQPYRPRPFNAMVEIDPKDANVTTADPVITQRIPRAYAETMKRLLSKP
ncbi:MAG: hypothetical protein HOH43_20960 [Candidatus Latescibacteria bacterium]|nr:hypothetical protein [Candidatus Latescibacterota bacterium]